MEYFTNTLKNFKQIDDNTALLTFHADIYSAETIVAVSHYMIGKCHTVITKDNKDSNKILVELTSEKKDIKKSIYEFNEEVNNYSFYTKMMKKNQKLREYMLERVLLCAQQSWKKDNSKCVDNSIPK